MRKRLTDRQLAVYVAAKDIERTTGAFPRAKALAIDLECTPLNVLQIFEKLEQRGWLARVGAGVYVPAQEGAPA